MSDAEQLAHDLSLAEENNALLEQHIKEQAQRIAQLEAERDELKRDAERLDWLEQHDGTFHNIDKISAIVGKGFSTNGYKNRFSKMREAIDAAMREQALDALAKTSEELGGYDAAEIGRAMG